MSSSNPDSGTGPGQGAFHNPGPGQGEGQFPASPAPVADQGWGAPATASGGAGPGPSGYPPQQDLGAQPPVGLASYPGGPSGTPGAWGHPYAHWGQRVLAVLVDVLYVLPGMVVMLGGIWLFAAGLPTRTRGTVVSTGNTAMIAIGIILGVVGFLAYLGVWLYNLLVVQGRTGQSWGKRHLGLRIIHEHTGRPLSIGMNVLRFLCHYIDGILYLGYLWPLWDAKRQTFADKIMTTLVVKARWS